MSRTLVNVFDSFGIDSLIYNAFGFVNIDEKFLAHDIVDLIPKDRFVLEILETTTVTQWLIDRVLHLKSQGYIFALDDFIFDEAYLSTFSPLMDKVDYIKVDIQEVDPSTLEHRIKILKKFPVKLIAEKVENQEEFELCEAAGFDYFQGYFFAKPVILEKKSADPSKISIIKIINLINNDAPVTQIVDQFNVNPELSINLLKFINSAIFFFRDSIKSIRHAVNLLGFKKLQNWLILLSYAKPNRSNKDTALLQTAVVRAKVMETLVSQHTSSNMVDSAFLTGILSLMDSLFQSPMHELIEGLNVDQEIKGAILNFEGELGLLLKSVIDAEGGKGKSVEESLEATGFTFNDFSIAQIESFIWYKKLMQEM